MARLRLTPGVLVERRATRQHPLRHNVPATSPHTFFTASILTFPGVLGPGFSYVGDKRQTCLVQDFVRDHAYFHLVSSPEKPSSFFPPAKNVLRTNSE